MKLTDDFAAIITYLSELCAVADHDRDEADPSWVGANGVPIRIWRGAYLEGCKDAASGVAARLPEGMRDEAKKLFWDTYRKKMADLRSMTGGEG